MISILLAKKTRYVQGACHPSILLGYSLFCPNENEGVGCVFVVCVCVWGGGVQLHKQSESIVINPPFQS